MFICILCYFYFFFPETFKGHVNHTHRQYHFALVLSGCFSHSWSLFSHPGALGKATATRSHNSPLTSIHSVNSRPLSPEVLYALCVYAHMSPPVGSSNPLTCLLYTLTLCALVVVLYILFLMLLPVGGM